jgi:Ion channel
VVARTRKGDARPVLGRNAWSGGEPGRRGWALLLLACLLSLALQGVSRPGDVQQVAVSVLSAVTVLLALHAARISPRLRSPAAVLAAAAVAVTVVRVTVGGVDEGAARATNAALVALGPPAIAVGVLRELRLKGQVGIEAVMGVLSLYILVGMFFGFLYGAIDHLGGAPFFAEHVSASVAHCLYFSFVTLTTVGYGDFAARSDLGHTLAVFEALLGQIYLVTVVSVIIGNLGRPARPGPSMGEE